MKQIKYISLLALVLIIGMIFAPAACAHRVHIREEITQVQIKAWYGGGDPMALANVEIYSTNSIGEEKLYKSGQTDEDGLYTFPPELGASYRVVVSQSGHKGEYEFKTTGESKQEEAELPLYMQILTGFGLLTGLTGMSMYISARKIQKESKEK